MTTYLFVTNPKFKPERVKTDRNPSWSCQKDARAGEVALVYVTGKGISYEWRIESDARPDTRWPYVCDVSLLSPINPPITIAELRGAIKKGQWKPLDQNFWQVKSIGISEKISQTIRNLRVSNPKLLNDAEKDFAKEVSLSLKLSVAQRQRRLKAAKKQPEKREVLTTVFARNADVVAEVLHRANGCCETCGEPAPFQRRSDKTPYLEVHHIKRLVDGGADTVRNARALCPNCHRKAHFG